MNNESKTDRMRTIMERVLNPTTIRYLDLKQGRLPISSINDLKPCFEKVCLNAYPAKKGPNEQQHYRHPDLERFATEAFNNGESFFYAEPEDPKQPYSRQKLVEPKYKYRLSRTITEEEFNALFGENKTTE